MEISQTEFSPFAIIFRYLFVIFVIIGRGVKKTGILQSGWL